MRMILLQSVFPCPSPDMLCRQEANGCVNCLAAHLHEVVNNMERVNPVECMGVDSLTDDEKKRWDERFGDVGNTMESRTYAWKINVDSDSQ